MKQLLHITLLLVSSITFCQSLYQGDIAFIGINTDAPEGFTIITLAEIPPSEQIYFTDRGIVNATTWIPSTEGTYLFTAPVNGIPCGTVINFTETSPDNVTITGVSGGASYVLQEGSFNLGSGDQMMAYQKATAGLPTTPSEATFIAAIHTDYDAACVDATTKWTQEACVSATSESVVPPGLTNGVNCISITPSGPERDNAIYIGSLAGTDDEIRGLIHDFNNWTTNDGPVININPSAYSPSLTCPTLSILDISLENEITIYPNPSKNGRFNVKKSNLIESQTIEVFDMLGQIVKKMNLGTDLKIDLSNQESGVYFIKIGDKNGSLITKKLIVN